MHKISLLAWIASASDVLPSDCSHVIGLSLTNPADITFYRTSGLKGGAALAGVGG